MNRRSFLGAVGSAVSLGYASRSVAPLLDTSEIRVWFTEAAAAYDGLRDRIAGYLRAAMDETLDGVRVTFVDEPVSVSAEDGRAVLANEWPRRVVEGTVGASTVDPVGGVNMLVTDGDPTSQPAGFARPRVAAVTGAGAIADMPPADETGATVSYSVRAAATQLVLHECGHALGANHEHGTANVRDGTLVASPMIGSYLWAPRALREKHLDDSGGSCDDGYPANRSGLARGLSLRYSDCATRAIRERHDELVP